MSKFKPSKTRQRNASPRVGKGPSMSPAEAVYRRLMLAMIADLKATVAAVVLPQIGGQTAAFQADLPITDGPDDSMTTLVRMAAIEFKRKWTPARIRKTATDAAAAIAGKQKAKFKEQFTVIGVDPLTNNPWLVKEVDSFVAENVSLITSIPDDYFTEVEGVVLRGIRNGDTVKTTGKKLQKVYGVTDRRARMIVRDQTGKFAGRLDQLRQQEAGIKKYIWRSASDGVTRPMHRALDGQEFEWDKPPVTNEAGDHNNPGQDYNCRCWAEPVLDDDFFAGV